MPWYDPVLSPFKRAWEKVKTDWREAGEEAERQNAWAYLTRRERRRIHWEALRGRIPEDEADRLIDEVNQRRTTLLKHLQGPAND